MIHVLRTQRNMRIHFLIAAAVLVAGVAVGVTRFELIALLLAIAFVLIAEMINTSIEHTIDLTRHEGIADDRFEFQMLFGVRPQLQLDLRRRGYGVRVATPFGPDWYPYLMRRLAERPANLLFFLRSVVSR